MSIKKCGKTILCVLLLAFLAACAPKPTAEAPCALVLEQGQGFTAVQNALSVPRGADAVFTLRLQDGFAVDSVPCAAYSLEQTATQATLTLHAVQYSQTIVVTAKRLRSIALQYHANGGSWLDAAPALRTVETRDAHLRTNTLPQGSVQREGYTQIGWNTQADGSGEQVGLGSRIAYKAGMALYAQWLPWASETEFLYQIENGAATITAYTGSSETLVVPARLGGAEVVALASGALENAPCHTLVLPATLRRMEPVCLKNSALQELHLFDTLTKISDECFAGCSALRTLRIHAACAPVYSGNYFDTYQDKLDRLFSLQGQKKLVLIGGSATRFGYDSAVLAQEFPEYAVCNLGVFAYSNIAPQFEILLSAVQAGDLVLHAPEFDAAQQQFCTDTVLNAPFFAMMESNYDAIASIDLRHYSQVFSAFNTYLYNKSNMLPRSYEITAADYDEDGNAVAQPSYNEYGDYIVPRPNAATAEPVFGYPAAYTVDAFPRGSYLAPLNAVYAQFLQKGATVYFTYAPRNVLALSAQSTPQARAALHAHLREELIVPVISPIEASLYSGIYLFETDNHLSTEGVAIHTQRIVQDLRAQMQKDGL